MKVNICLNLFILVFFLVVGEVDKWKLNDEFYFVCFWLWLIYRFMVYGKLLLEEKFWKLI